jgi:NAD(P)-dependent dehydrogenase (short-subunit alcohol dehydrogenase family)
MRHSLGAWSGVGGSIGVHALRSRPPGRLVHVPTGRFATADEIANAALFLASDESSCITASAFTVDGGITGAYTTPV